MTLRVGIGGYGLLSLFAAAIFGVWAYWEQVSSHDAWTIDEATRFITDFAPREPIHASFRLCNTATVPLRIIGASTC